MPTTDYPVAWEAADREKYKSVLKNLLLVKHLNYYDILLVYFSTNTIWVLVTNVIVKTHY